MVAIAFMGVKWVDIPWDVMDAYGPPFKENLYAVLIFIALSIIYIRVIVGYFFCKFPEKRFGAYMKIFHCFMIIILFGTTMTISLELEHYWWRIKFDSGEIWAYLF